MQRWRNDNIFRIEIPWSYHWNPLNNSIYIYTANSPRRHQMLFQMPLYLFEDAILSSHGFQPLPGLAGAAHLWVSEKTESWLPKPPTCPETGFSVGNFPPKNEDIKTRGVGRPSVGLWSMSVSRSFLRINYTFFTTDLLEFPFWKQYLQRGGWSSGHFRCFLTSLL